MEARYFLRLQYLWGASFVLYVTPTASIPFIQTLHTYKSHQIPWQVWVGLQVCGGGAGRMGLVGTGQKVVN